MRAPSPLPTSTPPSPPARDPTSPHPIAARKPLFRHPFRRRLLRPRTFAVYAAGAAALCAARPTGTLVAPGLALITAGQALRLWATGYLVKTDVLTTAGPYAYLRHPLYAGALAMGCGFALLAGPAVAAVAIPIGLVFYFGYYLRYKERVESGRLESLYGDAYRAYRAAVPALLPRRRPWRPDPDARDRWRLDRLLENDEQGALLYTVAGVAVLLALWLLRTG
jgi:protein-S-isoprenylcysteine O-methyltransferase Ste14